MTSVVSFAEETYTVPSLVQPRAASGSASLQTNKEWYFTVPVSGSSYLAHAMIMVQGITNVQTVTVSITKPDGNSVLPLEAVTLTNGNRFYQNFYNASAGNYKVHVIPIPKNFWFTTIVEILDEPAPR